MISLPLFSVDTRLVVLYNRIGTDYRRFGRREEGSDFAMATEEEKRLHRCCFAGHQLEKLDEDREEIKAWLSSKIDEAILDGYLTFIVQSEIGVNIWAGQVLLEKKRNNPDLKMIIVTPWEAFTQKRWSDGWKAQYEELVNNADLFVPVSQKYSKDVFEKTSEWIVNHSSRLIVYFNKMPGGAWDMVKYAEKHGLSIQTNYAGYETRKEKEAGTSNTTIIPFPQNIIRDIGYKAVLDASEYIELSEDQLAGLNYVIDALPERQRQIITYRYKDRLTLQDSGDKLGISRERARQIQVKGIARLRSSPNIMFIKDGFEKAELELKKQSAEAMRDLLIQQQKKRPWMDESDIVKFVFQGMLGVGHAVSSKEEVLEHLHEEMRELEEPEQGEPLTERLSPEWFRVNLRVAKMNGFQEEDLAYLVFQSAQKVGLSFTRQNVYNYCTKLVRSEEMRQAAEKVLDESWLPSHSDRYKSLYKPAYCVLHREFQKAMKTRKVRREEEEEE